MKQCLVKFTVVVDVDDDATDTEIFDDAVTLIDGGHGNFEYEEA